MSAKKSKPKASASKSGSKKTYQRGRRSRYKINKFRSKFEARIQSELDDKGVTSEYEKLNIEYVQVRKYKPDFVLKGENGKEIIVEAKGLFDSEDRRKHLDVKAQYPDYDIRFVFYANHKLYKGAKSHYSDWCEKNGFKYAVGSVPDEWLQELGLLITEKKEESNIDE